MKFHRNILLLFLFLFMITCAGCSSSKDPEESTQEENNNSSAEASTEGMDEITLEGMAADVLEDMTLDEKIGQLFFVCTDSLDGMAETFLTEEMKESLNRYQPGGIILFSFNLEDQSQTKNFIHDMQQEVTIPMFIGVDEEGGAVARIGNHENMGTTAFPSMKEIGEQGDTAKAYEVGSTIGKEISEIGFNLDFAPVADVMTNEENVEIGDRSFGEDPKLVSNMVKEVVKGLQSQGVSATLKHFPGQGSCGEDTHKGFANLDISIDEMRNIDFLPFEKGIQAGADLVMMSHVACGDVTGDDLPSSLSKIIVSDILRSELRYDGIIITDAMNMKSITKFFEADEAAIKAFKAGNDMILMPNDFLLAVEGISDAVKNGKIKEEKIDEAVTRILKVKLKRGIIPGDFKYLMNEE